MKLNRNQQAIAQEWMINPDESSRALSRLKLRSTYSQHTLSWLATQFKSLGRRISNS